MARTTRSRTCRWIELDATAEGRYHLETALALDPGRASVIGADLGRLDALQGDWEAALARGRQLLADPDPSVAQLGAVLEARLSSWRRDRQAALTAATRFARITGDLRWRAICDAVERRAAAMLAAFRAAAG